MNPPRQRPRGVSLLEQTMMEDRDNMLRVSIMDAPAPEHIARETRVARAAGQPPAMVGDVDYAEKAVNANRLTKVSAAVVEIFDLHTYPDRVGEMAGAC